MSAIFLKLLNMSITASLLVLAVVIFRAVFKRVPRFVTVILWALVAVRLLVPVTFESGISLLPSGEPIPQDIIYTGTPQINTNLPILDNAVGEILLDNFVPDETASVNPMQIVVFIASTVWVIGMLAMLVYALVSSLKVRRRVNESVKLYDNVYMGDRIPTPFIFGIIKPKICLPSCIDENDVECVIAHERAHLSRRDHMWKPLAFLLLSVYWFNPVLWIAYTLFARDVELATDEKVIKNRSEEEKKRYGNALINCSADRRIITACPLAFGENAVKGRVRNLFSYKRPTFWVLIIALVACLGFTAFFLTDPKTPPVPPMPDTPSEGEVFLDALVTSVDGRYMTVKSFEFSFDALEEGIYKVSLEPESDIPLPDVRAGINVRIVYDGDAEDHEIDRVFAIYAFESDAVTPTSIDDFRFRSNYYGGKTLVEYTGSAESVVIPAVIDGKAVTEIANSAFNSNMTLKSVYIPDGVQRIGAGAFKNCLHLESVRMPISCAVIGAEAFASCGDLVEITLPEALLQIGGSAFERCYSLEYLRVPSSIQLWGSKCFFDCGVKEVVVADGLETLGKYAFAECVRLEKVTLPDEIMLDSCAFFNCSWLESINVSENVTFGANVFEGCKKLPDELKDK